MASAGAGAIGVYGGDIARAIEAGGGLVDGGAMAELYSSGRMHGRARRLRVRIGKDQTCSVDGMFRAFSDRTRLRILHMLRSGELCVCDLVTVIDAPQPKISRHLAYLRRAGLVVVRKEGLWSHYRLAAARGGFHRKLLECLGNCFRNVPELRRDAALLKKIRRCRAGRGKEECGAPRRCGLGVEAGAPRRARET